MHNNFDQNELAKFAQLAAHWWDPNGDLKTLHQLNPLRLEFISKKLRPKDLKIIDIGCGGGILSEGLAHLGADVTGIDMNQSLIEVAKLHQFESGTSVKYVKKTAEEMASEEPNHYDVAICLEMLEHVPDPESIVNACAKLVKPGGHIFFSTLNRNPKSYLFAILGAEYILKLLPKNTHDFAKFIRPSELSQWVRKYGLTVQEIKGIHYRFSRKEFSLTNDISVNYLMHARKIAHE